MSGPLIDVSYVETIYGVQLDDEVRCEALILIASDLVCEEVGTPYTALTAPSRAKQAVCDLVISALSTDDEGSVKAEQIGDYRVEYARSRAAMDLGIVAHLLGPLRRGAYSVKTPLGVDGPADASTTSWYPFVAPGDDGDEIEYP
jgi:hypothetical protein